MKRQLVLTGCLLLLTGSMMGRQAFTGIRSAEEMERFLVVTDRGHYITGEQILFRAFNPGIGSLGPAVTPFSNWSRILYVELVTPEGTSLGKSKIPIGPDGGSGRMAIPEGISSGTYYLRAYTRWMRNCGIEAFSYTSVQVYDPFKDTVIPSDSTVVDMAGREFRFVPPEPLSGANLDCRLERTSFGTRQRVDMALECLSEAGPVDVSVTVARTGLHGNQHYFVSGCGIKGDPHAPFLPETHGISLTGQAVSREGGNPAPYATIYVSVLGDDPDFFCNYSDSAGRFFFSFPDYKGERDLFVSTFHPGLNDLELLIDRDFQMEIPGLPSFPVRLTGTMAGVVTEMSVNAQVAQQYYPPETLGQEETPGQLETERDKGLFYGHPSATILFDDFIRLPTLEEYFQEVIPQASVRKNRGIPRFVVIGNHPDLEIYQPLVMIDGVAIFDVRAILNVSPRLIQRIEIINAPYIRGNVTFGGIISIITKNHDLGFIDLPSSGLLVSYQMLDADLPMPVTEAVEDPRLPDVRNTLFWDPQVAIHPGETRNISFVTADLKGSYEIQLRGIDSTGKPIVKSVPFTVE
jgi:hypothetical protein